MKIIVLDGSEAKEIVDPFYEENGRATRARDSDLFFIAILNDEIVGAMRYCIEEEIHLLRGMFIQEEYRKQGIGQKLLEEFEKFLIQSNIQRTYCLPYSHLTKFYHQIGFEQIAPEKAPKYLRDRFKEYVKTQEHIIMKREIVN